MGDIERLEKELQELIEIEKEIKSLKVIRNLKFLVESYIEKERAVSSD